MHTLTLVIRLALFAAAVLILSSKRTMIFLSQAWRLTLAEAMTLSVAQLAILLRHAGVEEDVEPMVTLMVICQWPQLRAPMGQHTI